MAMKVILTNNPAVLDRYPPFARYLEGGVMAVLTAARDEIHKGARLLNHPQSGNFELNETPYRSIVIQLSKGSLHFESLQLIEHAISTLSRLPKKNHQYSEAALADYREIDLDLIKGAIPCQNHMTS